MSDLKKILLGLTTIFLASCASDEVAPRHPGKSSTVTHNSSGSTSRNKRPSTPQAVQPTPTPPVVSTLPPPPAPLLDEKSAIIPAHIGLAIPLSGPLAPIGDQILRGTRLGLNLEKGFDSAFQIFLVDSEQPELELRAALEKLIYHDQVIAVIGAGKNVTLISDVAEKAQTPVVLFSQRNISPAATETFRNFLTTEMQVLYLVSELRAQGVQRFATLYPNDSFGVEASNFFWDAVVASGGQMAAAESYDTREHDFRVPVQRLVGLDDIAARAQEYKEKLKVWQDQNANKKNAKEPSAVDLLKPWVDFDALFIPDSVQNLGQISAMLSFQNVRGLKVVGLNLWDTPELLRRVNSNFNPILFVDDFSTLEDGGKNHPFSTFYISHFNFQPQGFDVLGFETATTFKKIINKGVRNRESFRQELARYSDPQGLFGPLTVSPQREFERPVSLYSFDGSRVQKSQ